MLRNATRYAVLPMGIDAPRHVGIDLIELDDFTGETLTRIDAPATVYVDTGHLLTRDELRQHYYEQLLDMGYLLEENPAVSALGLEYEIHPITRM